MNYGVVEDVNYRDYFHSCRLMMVGRKKLKSLLSSIGIIEVYIKSFKV